MSTIRLSLTQLRAAILAAAKNDIRWYLNSVYVEAGPQTTRVASTNGHILYVQDLKTDENTWHGSLIVPRNVVELVIKGTTAHTLDIVILSVQENGKLCEMRVAGNSNAVTFAPLEAQFPDYTRVIPPANYEPKVAYLNPEYVALMGKIAKVHGCKHRVGFTIHQNGEGAALVNFWNCEQAVGVIMPIRDDGKMNSTEAFRERVYVPPSPVSNETTQGEATGA